MSSGVAPCSRAASSVVRRVLVRAPVAGGASARWRRGRENTARGGGARRAGGLGSVAAGTRPEVRVAGRGVGGRGRGCGRGAACAVFSSARLLQEARARGGGAGASGRR